MRALSAQDLLRIWDYASGAPPVRRALYLLRAASGEELESLRRMPVGRRDRLLFQLREWAFGNRLNCWSTCPACGERLESSFTVADIVREEPSPAPEAYALQFDGFLARFRLPDSADLEAIERYSSLTEARSALLDQCVLSVEHGAESLAPGHLPEPLLARIVEEMERCDPQANILLDFHCAVATCGHRWTEHFDIVSFFWKEIHVWARRTFREVHALASAYGWSEAEIISMSPMRRQLYLEMVSR